MRTESKIEGYRENLEGSTFNRRREEMTEQLLRRSCLVLPMHLLDSLTLTLTVGNGLPE